MKHFKLQLYASTLWLRLYTHTCTVYTQIYAAFNINMGESIVESSLGYDCVYTSCVAFCILFFYPIMIAAQQFLDLAVSTDSCKQKILNKKFLVTS